MCERVCFPQVGKVGDCVLEAPDESIFFAASALPTVRAYSLYCRATRPCLMPLSSRLDARLLSWHCVLYSCSTLHRLELHPTCSVPARGSRSDCVRVYMYVCVCVCVGGWEAWCDAAGGTRGARGKDM